MCPHTVVTWLEPVGCPDPRRPVRRSLDGACRRMSRLGYRSSATGPRTWSTMAATCTPSSSGTGSERWTVALGAPSEESPPLVTDGALVVGDASGGLHALDLPDGTPLWTRRLDGAIAGSPASSGRSIVVGTMGGSEYVLDDESGSIKEQVTLPGSISRSTALSGDTAFASAGGSFRCVDVGRVARVADPARRRWGRTGTPTVADGLVFVAVGIEGPESCRSRAGSAGRLDGRCPMAVRQPLAGPRVPSSRRRRARLRCG